MAATRSVTPVLSLKRPQHEVELFNLAFNNDCVLVLSQQTSKSFICYQVILEYTQSESESEKWAVVLTDSNSELDGTPLIKLLNRLLPRKPVVFSSQTEFLRGSQNVMLTSATQFQHCIETQKLAASNISVVINITTLNPNPPAVLETLRKDGAKPRLINLMQLDLSAVCNPQDLKTELESIETAYDLPIFMSKDILSMNAYGEEIVVERISYGSKNLNPTERKVWKVLQDYSNFLQSLNVPSVSKSVAKLRAVLAWSLEVLVIFGLWSLSFRLECIRNTLSEMFRQENDVFVRLAIESCGTLFDFIEKVVNDDVAKNKCESMANHSCLMLEILKKLQPYQVYCKLPASTNSEHAEENEQKPCANHLESEQSSKLGGLTDAEKFPERAEETESKGGTEPKSALSMVVKCVQKLREKSQFHCIIVTRSNSCARLFSKFINYMSSCDEKYSFMKAGYVTHTRSMEEDERTENTLQAVVQGMVNILVTTRPLFSDLSLTTFNVLVYFGAPASYHELFTIKNKIRGLTPKVILVIHQRCTAFVERNLKVFSDIESVLAEQVPGYISQATKERWLRCVAEEPQCCYMPFGEKGPSVSMEESIHIINRYCRRMNRGDFCNLHVEITTEKKCLTGNRVELATKLYLPLSSSSCTVIQGPPVLLTDVCDLELGMLKSRMLTSLECVKILHANGKMDDNLDLTEDLYVDGDNQKLQNFELEDEGKGRAGTNKRKRAYEIKVPSFFQENMPRENEMSFLYKIQFDDPTIYRHSRSGSLHSLPEPEFELGILSRKPLPKMQPFFIYTCKSDVEVSLTASTSVKVDDKTLSCIRLFHHYVFAELHKFGSQSTVLSDSDGYLVVPLLPTAKTICNGVHIHQKFLQEFSNFFESDLNSNSASKDCTFFQNKIVRRLNESANQTHYSRYFVIKVCHDLTPASPFPNEDVAATFAEYYENRYGIQVSPEQPLLLVQHLPAQVNFIVPRHRHQTTEVYGAAKEKVSRTEIHLIPELCSTLPLSASAWSLARYLPAVVYRIEALLRAHEMVLRIHREAGVSGCLGKSDDSGPSMALVMHALTAKSAGQQFHSEELEVLGDSWLKLEVSLELFLSGLKKDEWALSVYRNHLVSNDLLSAQGRRLGIPGFISITPPDLTNTSVPPGFILEPSVKNGVENSSLNRCTHIVLGDKHVANCVEALIAATLVSCGRDTARRFLTWLGVLEYTCNELEALFQQIVHQGGVNYIPSEQQKVALEEFPENNLNSEQFFKRPLPSFEHIELELGYCFKNKLLLLQALTHDSYSRMLSQVGGTYQKMEFLGDAVLDYLVTRYLFDHFPCLNHGDVTDFRSALVNNFTLAFLAVQNNLHLNLRHMSPPLLNVILQFLEFLEEQKLKQGASWKTSIDAFVVGSQGVEDRSVEVPKVLGDVFEAVICAVFLDSGMELWLVWDMLLPMFMPFINYYKDNIPRSPVRLLKETFPDGDKVTFSLARLTLSRQYKSSVTVQGFGKFHSIGRTPKIAKASVARKALLHVRATSGEVV